MNKDLFEAPPATPLPWLQQWVDEARDLDLHEPMAMNLATVSADGKPSSRIVLLKGLVGDQIHFFTNYDSRKGDQLGVNHDAALCFWWDSTMRQIRIEGRCNKLGQDQSDSYFQSRERGSQLGAWASQQSQPIANRASLEQAFQQTEQRFANSPVPRPPHWGGYALSIEQIEFWQGRDNRFHDRMLFTRETDSWTARRLQP